jgi:protein-disulfide isomerase
LCKPIQKKGRRFDTPNASCQDGFWSMRYLPASPSVRLLLLACAVLSIGGALYAVATQGPPAAAGRSEASMPVAVVNGAAITLEELEAGIGASLGKLEQDIYTLKRDRLQSLINERLLTAEASRRGIDVKQLVETEITAKVAGVSEEDVTTFYEANKARIPEGTADIRGQIRRYLTGQRTQTRAQAFVAELRKGARVEVTLPEPAVRRTAVDLGDAPIRGHAAAPVTVVEFSDFHCPFCKRVNETLLDLLAKYPNQVRVVYKDLPIDSLHPNARRAHEAARCARDQNKFWEFHDKLFEGNPDASDGYLRSLAADTGLDTRAFDLCLETGRHKSGVESDIEQGRQLGIDGTPMFYINGRALSGAQPIEAFTAIIDEELKRDAAR